MIDVLGYNEQEANDEIIIYSLNDLFTPEQLEDCKKYNTPAEITSRADEHYEEECKNKDANGNACWNCENGDGSVCGSANY